MSEATAGPTSAASPGRSRAFRLLSLALGGVVGLGLAELFVRLVPFEEIVSQSTAIKARTRTGDGRPDFRRYRFELDKRPDTFRVLALGDSYTWGDGVHAEDAYPRRLERRLNGRHQKGSVEVIPWARPGWNTVQETRAVRDRLSRLEPDLVILGFVLNDAEPAPRGLRLADREEIKRRRPEGGLSELLYRRSRLYHLLYERIENTRQRRRLVAFYHDLYRDGPAWGRCVRALKELRSLAREHEFSLLLVIFPIFDSELDDSYPYRDLHETVRRTAESLDIAVLDTLPAYEGVEARRLAVVPFTDPHPNELAHRIAADYLVRYLHQQGLVPAG